MTAALEERHLGELIAVELPASLKLLIEERVEYADCPELFCFGLLEQFDVKQLAALVAPRPLRIVGASERVKKELAGLKKWYATLGKDFDPFESK